jgi:hypothetical protein
MRAVRCTIRIAAVVLFILLGGLAVPLASAFENAVHVYYSSVDGAMLLMSVVYPDSATNCPIVAVVHGYSGGMQEVFQTQILLADRDLFTIAPAMRGRNNSGGSADDSAWELTDILDAIETVKGLYPGIVDPGNVNLFGFSGGGGNTFGCMSKFPDTFRLAAEFFGIADYGYDLTYGWYHYGGEGVQSTLRQRIGGAPEQVPDRYMARNSLLAVGNCRQTAFHLYVDSEELTCPPYNDTTYASTARGLGLVNVVLHVSTPDSLYRWIHGYPHQVPDLLHAIDALLPGVFDGSYPAPVLDPSGALTVLGYLRTAPFTIVLADGMSETADLTYDISGTTASPEEAWRLDLTNRTGPAPQTDLRLRGLAPSTPFWVDDLDVLHGIHHQTVVESDAAGVIHYVTSLNTIAQIRVYRADWQAIPPDTARVSTGARMTVSPNPARGGLRISLDGIHASARSPFTVRLLDAGGRTVAVLDRPERAPGRSGERCVWSWDGRAPDGRPAPAGVYLAVLGMGPARRTTRLVITR